MMTKLELQKAKYFTSVADLEQLPADEGYEVAFIGRSNSGKSSALNAITGIKGLARTSGTPGRTQMINFFALDNERRLVDLPGYGYAKAPRTVQERWSQNIDEYLRSRQCLRALVMTMDIRHPLKDMDQAIIAWTVKCKVPLHILLTKADKLNTQAARKTLQEVQDSLQKYGNKLNVQNFSSLEKIGLDEVREQLLKWLDSAE